MTRVKPLRRMAYSAGVGKASKTGFFSEYTDTIFSHALLLLMLLLLFYAPGGLLWHYTNSPTSSIAFKVSELYLFILIPAMIWVTIDMADERNTLFSATGFGGVARILVGVAAGVTCFTIFDFGMGLSFYESFLAAETLQLFFFIVIVASVVEEIAFRGSFFPMLTRIFEAGFGFNNILSGVMALFIVSLAFGLFHWTAYGAKLNAMVVAMLFSVVFILGNYFFRTLAFSMSWHMLHNGWGYYQTYGLPNLPVEVVVATGVLLVGIFILGLAKLVYGFKRIKTNIIRN